MGSGKRRQHNKRKSTAGTEGLIFGRMQKAMTLFLVMAAILMVERRNVIYEKTELQLDVLDDALFSEAPFQKEDECMIYWDSSDENSKNACNEMSKVLSEMNIAYDTQDLRTEDFIIPEEQNIVVALGDLSAFGEQLPDLFDLVETGRGLLLICPPDTNSHYFVISDQLGVRETDYERYIVNGIRFKTDFMIGGEGRDIEVSDPYESSNLVYLYDDCTVHLASADELEVPLIWERDHGQGRIVNVNLNYFEKAYRGFYAAAYSLLSDYCVWPVINGSAFYLDDFPSPVPAGDGKYIQRDYQMDIETFYTNVWWPDMQELARKYGIRYTGLVIENYSDEHELPLYGNDDIQRFRYFGNEVLDGGGEIGFHGYNHMPLVLEDFDYGEEFPSYKKWKSEDDIRGALEELSSFCTMAFPKETFHVYVPPSNILSEDGRRILSEDFLDIKAIASIYFPGEYEYTQDFEVAEDGIVETPRIISGLTIDPYMEMAAISELNLHFVNSHFLHPDDVLDEDRGAARGWERLYGRLEEYADWLYSSAPDIRNLTGTEIAGAVQRFYYIDYKAQLKEDGLYISLSGLKDEAWLLVRIREGVVTETEGGESSPMTSGLYLVKAVDDEVILKLGSS